jgi:hypothetical protein
LQVEQYVFQLSGPDHSHSKVADANVLEQLGSVSEWPPR